VSLLAGKSAIVSGVGPGLGQAIALAMAREGAAVTLAARSVDYLDDVAGQITGAGGRAVAVPTDITDLDQCRNLVAQAAAAHGGVDVLVNSAFRPDVFQRFETVDLQQWRAMFDVNVFGTLQLTQQAIPRLKES
jgi:NAD(P)-dependent dehydrogenase (short-subunit alcohol dehydrogenase family)